MGKQSSKYHQWWEDFISERNLRRLGLVQNALFRRTNWYYRWQLSTDQCLRHGCHISSQEKVWTHWNNGQGRWNRRTCSEVHTKRKLQSFKWELGTSLEKLLEPMLHRNQEERKSKNNGIGLWCGSCQCCSRNSFLKHCKGPEGSEICGSGLQWREVHLWRCIPTWWHNDGKVPLERRRKRWRLKWNPKWSRPALWRSWRRRAKRRWFRRGRGKKRK